MRLRLPREHRFWEPLAERCQMLKEVLAHPTGMEEDRLLWWLDRGLAFWIKYPEGK